MVSNKHPAQEGFRVTLHIGANKTGSSALQKLLFTNRNALRRNSVLYPDVGVASNAHHILFGAIHPGAWRLHKDAYDVSRSEYFVRGVDKLLERARKTDCRHLVLSSEYLWGEFSPLVYKQVRDAFAGSQIRIFACLREPSQWQEATYLRAVKSGERRHFSKWKAETSCLPYRGFDFDLVLKKWAEGVDAVSTTVVHYGHYAYYAHYAHTGEKEEILIIFCTVKLNCPKILQLNITCPLQLLCQISLQDQLSARAILVMR